jgi:methyl halide transferase
MHKEYWNSRYIAGDAPWDIGGASPSLVNYADQLTDRNISILIPGAGNAYDAIALKSMGFSEIIVLDISDVLIQKLKRMKEFDGITLFNEDFFDHSGEYDLVLEQTFFCALPPQSRRDYVQKMYDLLRPGAKLVGLLFSVVFEKPGPPWGGTLEEYDSLFSPLFEIHIIETSQYSIPPRQGSEYFINFVKKN